MQSEIVYYQNFAPNCCILIYPQFRKDEVQEEYDIPYNYGFFHLVFSLGAMYFAMLLINWNINSSTRK